VIELLRNARSPRLHALAGGVARALPGCAASSALAQPAARGSTDAERLATGELVYPGVLRTPLCALARRVRFGRAKVHVMNEFFATPVDGYRLTGELAAAHDQHRAADGGRQGRSGHAPAATRQRPRASGSPA